MLFFCVCRVSEVVALVSLSTTIFLFIHTRDLTLRLAQQQQTAPSGPEFEDISIISSGRSPSRELSTAQDRQIYGKVSWRIFSPKKSLIWHLLLTLHCLKSPFSRLAVSKCPVIYHCHVCDLSQMFLLLKCCVSECFWLIAESMAPVSCIMSLLWCFLYHVSCFMVSRPIAGKVYSSNALCTVSMYSYELWQGGRMLWRKGDVSLMNPTWRLISTHKKSSSLHEMCAELVQHLGKFAP